MEPREAVAGHTPAAAGPDAATDPPQVPEAGPDAGDGTPLVLTPVPLATGDRLPGADGATITAVELVVTTADGVQTRVPLRAEHGAWWAPTPPPEV